jgi:hypothetical protein
MSESSDLDPEELPQWVRAAFERAMSAAPTPSVLDHRDDGAWPLLLEAAVVRSFLPRQLAPETASTEERPQAEQTVLRYAETNYGPEGVKWSLTADSRMQVVNAALNRGELGRAIESTASRFTDDVSKAFRTCLDQRPDVPKFNLASLVNTTLRSLEAARTAIASLSGLPQLELPPLEQLDRQIELRRLLAQFERMTGRRPEERRSSTEQNDLFYGREDELEKLRGYVGVIPADSLLQSAKRAGKWVSRKIKGRAPLSVWGIGGSGKTTLISKFMLEHAEKAASRYPFAYLDFDRTTIGARQRLGLLDEMCSQVVAQFDELAKPMGDLQREVRQLSRDLEVKHEFESNSFVEPCCQKFRRLIDDLMDSLEKFEWSRPFLLVFDTFEIVQYTDGEIEGQDDIKGLEEFVQNFTYPDETGPWDRLRLIISGRQKITRFLGPVEDLHIGALDRIGSAKLLTALAQDAGRPITDNEAKRLVEAVAKLAKEKNRGIQPLRLRLIGEVFREAEGGGKQIVESLLDEFNKPLTGDGKAAEFLVEGILVTRILKHVKDDRVRALADPGLVVRRITPAVIKAVMTRGTMKPDLLKPGKYDANEELDMEVLEPWIVDDAEAESIFTAFRKEVSLVEKDGDALRHRADVRQQMLPLIRARRPTRFRTLNQLAFDHFRKLAQADQEDLASAAEAIYHGLWLDEESLESIDNLWRDARKFKPRLDPADFDAGSRANIYLRAKTRKALKPAEVVKLPRGVALDWLDARSADLLENRRVDQAIEAIRNAAGSDYSGLDERLGTAAILSRLLYRAGLWQEAADLALRHLDKVTSSEFAIGSWKISLTIQTSIKKETQARVESVVSLMRTFATIAGKSGTSALELSRISGFASEIEDPIACAEVSAHVIVACTRFGNQWRELAREVKAKSLLRSALAITPKQWLQDKKLLRLVILSDDDSSLSQLLPIWVDSSDRVPRDASYALLESLLTQLFPQGDSASEVEDILQGLKSNVHRGAYNRLDELWRKRKREIQRAVSGRSEIRPLIRALVAADNSDWIRPLGNSLTRAFKGDDGQALISALEKADFRISTGKRDRKQKADGIVVAQSALDDGRFLELANTVLQHSARFERLGSSEYPQDVFSICRSLLRWQATLSGDVQGKSWEDAPLLESRLKRAVDSFDWHQADSICEEIVGRIRKSIDRIPESSAKRLMNTLRRKRRFSTMLGLAEAIIISGQQSPQVRRLYAQALIDLKDFDRAEQVLQKMIHDPTVIPAEVVEAKGLIGRIHKQIYVDNNDPNSEANRQKLRSALDEYQSVYQLDPEQYLWHGINVVALAARAKRDNIPIEIVYHIERLAEDILSVIEDRDSKSSLDLPAYDVATQLEALVALRRDSEAAAAALRYVDCVDADAFEISSTSRQLTEVWQLNLSESPGKHILPILDAALISKEGLTFDKASKDVKAEVVALGAAVTDLGTMFGEDRLTTLAWYKKGLEQCSSICRIETLNGKGHGTGFLVSASDFFPGREGVLLLTSEHILSERRNPSAILPDEARAHFQNIDQILEIDSAVWFSPYTELDVVFLSLKGEPKAPPLRIHQTPLVMTAPPPRLYMIGHPGGRDLEFSLQDNQLLACNETVLHYRTPSEPGSSGSPVFESDDWRVVAIHHKGSGETRRLDGKGTYEANEGISILAVRAATQRIFGSELNR